MSADLKKFEELMKTDAAFQEKLKGTAEKFKGDATDTKAVFEQIVLPVAKEAGLTATYEEYIAYVKAQQERNMKLSKEELKQVSGGNLLGIPSASECTSNGVKICVFTGYAVDLCGGGFGTQNPGEGYCPCGVVFNYPCG